MVSILFPSSSGGGTVPASVSPSTAFGGAGGRLDILSPKVTLARVEADLSRENDRPKKPAVTEPAEEEESSGAEGGVPRGPAGTEHEIY